MCRKCHEKNYCNPCEQYSKFGYDFNPYSRSTYYDDYTRYSYPSFSTIPRYYSDYSRDLRRDNIFLRYGTLFDGRNNGAYNYNYNYINSESSRHHRHRRHHRHH